VIVDIGLLTIGRLGGGAKKAGFFFLYAELNILSEIAVFIKFDSGIKIPDS